MDQSQLLQVESLCHALYQGTNSAQRSEAQQQLLTLQSSIDFIPQCQFILDHSTQPYAQIVACSSLENLVTQFWINFTIPQKVGVHNYILSFLGSHADKLQEFVLGHLTKLSARITKLGWFDSIEFREVINEINKFLDVQSISHNLVGIKLLNALVDEMNTPISGRTLTVHRKTAVSFRDHILLNIFTLSINQLKMSYMQLKSGIRNEQLNKLVGSLLQLATQCLSFDFIGTNPEESNEDVGTLQVPSSWRNAIQETPNLQLFFDLYTLTEPPRSNLALEAIVQLSSVRRSLFSSEQERTAFLQGLITNLHVIMKSKHGLEHMENYHEFCRILGRLKASYQLSELVKLNNFTDFLELAGDFTIKSLVNWQSCMNSIHYLLALWGRLVAALPYLRADVPDSQKQANILKQINLTVVQNYIKTMLDSVEVVINSDGDVEDPLDDEGSLKEQMERLPVIARLQYDIIAQYLVSSFEQALAFYHQCMVVIYKNASVNTAILSNLPTNPGILSNISNLNSAQIVNQIQILEGRMTWLVYMIAAVIDNNTSSTVSPASDLRKNQNELMWDGRLSRCVFQLITILEYKTQHPGLNPMHHNVHQQIQHNDKLEISILNFFRAFKKMYLLDSMVTSSSSSTMAVNRLIVPGGSPAHPLLSLVLSDSSRVVEKESEIANIYDAMGIGDVVSIMGVVVKKLCNDIKHYHHSDVVLQDTLEVFVDLITSYSSSKTLLNLDIVNYIIHNHNGSDFPFLSFDNATKYRITFYSALSRLVFTSSEDLNNLFDVFMAPNLSILQQLMNTVTANTSEAKSGQVKWAVVGALRDLRGITASAYNKRTYSLIFEALYPQFFPLFRRIAEIFFDDPVVMTALLKFMQVPSLSLSMLSSFHSNNFCCVGDVSCRSSWQTKANAFTLRTPAPMASCSSVKPRLSSALMARRCSRSP